MDSIALSVLQNFFGDYVEGIDSKNLVADLSGIEVKNLKLKKSALEGLELPIEVKEGILQRVSLKLPPLTELTKKPAKVLVEKLYILVSPIYRTTDTQEVMVARKQLSKIKLLDIGEILAKNAIYSVDEKEKKEEDLGWIDTKIAIVIGNIQVTVKELHIRYEDSVSQPSIPFVFGITLEEVTYQACNAKWGRQFFEKIEEITYKLTEVKNLAIYLCNQAPFQWNTVEELVQLMSCKVSGADTTPQQTTPQPSLPSTPVKAQPTQGNSNAQAILNLPSTPTTSPIAISNLPPNLPSNLPDTIPPPDPSKFPSNATLLEPILPQSKAPTPQSYSPQNPSSLPNSMPSSLHASQSDIPPSSEPNTNASSSASPMATGNLPPKPSMPPPLPPHSPAKQTAPQHPNTNAQPAPNNATGYPFQPLSSPHVSLKKQQQQQPTAPRSTGHAIEIVPMPKSTPTRVPMASEHQKLPAFAWDAQFKKFGKYILSPISGTFRNRYDMAKEFNFLSPKTTTEAIISEVRIRIDASQYMSIQKFLQWSRDYKLRLEFVSLYDYRPKVSPSISKESALQWWGYAIRCGLLRVQEARLQWSSDVQKDKEAYSNIYQKVVKTEKLRPQEQDALNLYERKYNLQQLSWFRRWTHAKIVIEKRESVPFFSSWFSSSKEKEKTLTEEQKLTERNKQIFDLLEKASKLQTSDNFPEDYIQTVIRILWEKLSIEIFDKNSKNLMCGTMNNLDFDINLRADLNSTLQQWFGGEATSEPENSIEDIDWKHTKAVAKEALQQKLQEKEKQFELELQKRYEIMLHQFQQRVEREMDVYRKKVENEIQNPRSDDWITLNLGGETFKTKLSVLLRDSSFFQLVFSELIEMQSREETVHNRIASSESQLHDFNNNYKTEKETLELWVGDLSRQLMDEREKRKKLESDIEILKVQVTALTKYVQSCQSS